MPHLCYLPGSSEYIVGGALMCMYHEVQPVKLNRLQCDGVYIRVMSELPRLYDDDDCKAVLNGITSMNLEPDLAYQVLLQGEQAPGHPLPSFYTVETTKYRVDFHVYVHELNNYLYASLIRRAN